MQYNLSERLKLLRKKLGLSQTNFGRRLGKNYHTVMRWEQEKVLPSEKTIRHIADTFKISPDWLMSGEGELSTPENIAKESGNSYIAEEAVKIPASIKSVNRPSPGKIEIYAPFSSSPPVVEGDILTIEMKDVERPSLCLIVDKYKDAHIRWFNPENGMVISKRDDYQDMKVSEVEMIGFVTRIMREIKPV